MSLTIGMLFFTACMGKAAYRGGTGGMTASASSVRVASAEADAPAPADPATGAAAQSNEKLVITGNIVLAVDHGPAAVKSIREAVQTAGGRVTHDEESGVDHHWTAHLQVRLPPGDVSRFVDELDTIGKVVSRRLESTDVSRQYFDQEIALGNLRVTLDRLQKLLGTEGLKTADVLEIERELNRVRGEIERIEGEHRYLSDRIEYATLDLHLSGSATVVLSPQARVHPGVHGTVLFLIDAAEDLETVRPGVGITLYGKRSTYLELDIYPEAGDDSGRAIIATTGGATYSDFLGDGTRRWLNPYLGGRIGYGWLDRSSYFVAAGEVGVELFKHERVIVDAAMRGIGLIGKNADAAFQATAGVLVPF